MAVRILEASDFEGIVLDRHARIGIKQDLVVAAVLPAVAIRCMLSLPAQLLALRMCWDILKTDGLNTKWAVEIGAVTTALENVI